MNVNDLTEQETIQLDLKYCERCGGLWLRPLKTNGVYCARCKQHFEALPARSAAPPLKARRRKSRARASNSQAETAAEGPAQIDYIQGTASMEAWA